MKIKFFIQGQKLKRAKNDYIVADSKNFISADFEFSQEWTNMQKSAIFKNADTAYTVLLTDNECAVPYEVTGADFCVSVFGVGENMRITSDEIVIRVEETGYCEGETPQEPTQSVYEQIVERLSDAEDVHTQIEAQLLAKADKTEVEEGLALKADKEQTEAAFGQKADKTQTEAQLLTKADKTEVEEALALKADKEQTEVSLSQKANQEELQQLNAEMNARCSAIETTHEGDIIEFFDAVNGTWDKAENIETYIIGDKSNLQTAAKMIVPAINEVQQEVIDLQGVVGAKADISYVDESISSANEMIAHTQISLDTKADKSEWELLEEITTEEELTSIARTMEGYGISEISAVMVLCEYPIDENGVKYGIHNSINYKTEYEKPVNIFSWKPTLATSKGYYWLMANKESGFVAQSSATAKAFDTAFSSDSARFSAMPIKSISRVTIGSYAEGSVVKAIPKGSVFRIYGKGVVRNA